MKPWTSCGNSCPSHKHRWSCAAEFVHYGVAAPYERAMPPSASCCAPPQQLFLFAQLARLPIGGGPVYIYRGVWLPSPNRVISGAVSVRCGRAPAENRPGSPVAASDRGERQALKLMGYTSHVGGLRPAWATLIPGSRRRAQGDSMGPWEPSRIPGSGPLIWQGRARDKGPPMLRNPPPDS